MRISCLRLICWLAGVTLSCLALPGLAAPTAELRILTWSEYMDPAIVKEFEARYNARVHFSYFESDETRTDILLETEGVGYDMVMVNGISLASYHKRGWLAPLDETQIPNLKYIDARWKNAFAEAAGLAAPFFWGTMGIGYRSDLVDQPLTSWMDLLRPQEKLRGRIVMINSSRDLVGIAMQALGHSVNSTDPQQLAEAEALLLEQKPHVKSYSYVSLSKESALVSGEVVAAMMYSGDALMVQEFHEDIIYVVPEEGSNLWVDYWTVLQSSEQKSLAMQFINFINEPEIAARMAEYVYYATPNLAAEKLLPEDFLSNQSIYPGKEVMQRTEVYAPLPPRFIKKLNTAFSRIIR